MENHLNAIISKNLMRIRIARKYTQGQIADALQIKQPSYNKMENGRTRINAEQLWILATFYRVSMEIFFLENAEASDNEITARGHNAELLCQIEELKGKMDSDRLFYDSMLSRLRDLEEKVAQRDEVIESLLAKQSRKAGGSAIALLTDMGF